MKLNQYIWQLCVAGVLWATSSQGALIFSVNQDIADNSETGIHDTQTLSGFTGIVDTITISLDIFAADLAFNGDYYVTLQHDTGFSVLLNRAGKTAANPLGYGDNGFNITFTLSGGADIHSYQDNNPTFDGAGRLTGSWDVDGRAVDPATVLDTDARTATLANFSGLDANGDWTLFVADVSQGGTATLVNWGLDIQTVDAVPEPVAIVLLLGSGTSMLVLKRWFIG